jgi:hypothetical protein
MPFTAVLYVGSNSYQYHKCSNNKRCSLHSRQTIKSIVDDTWNRNDSDCNYNHSDDIDGKKKTEDIPEYPNGEDWRHDPEASVFSIYTDNSTNI